MKTYIFLYQEVSLFEVDLVAFFFKTKGDVYIVTEGDEVIHTNEGIRVMADKKIGEISKEDLDVLVICGGNTENIKDMSSVQKLIRECNIEKKVVGGICAGSEMVANALGINSNMDKTIVLDERVVLSPGNEYVDFAITLGKVANIYDGEDDYQETIDYFKHFKYLNE